MIGSDNSFKQKYGKFILPLVLIAAFLLLYAVTGYKIHIDSHQYIAMHIRRDPVYPLFLFLLRRIFGEGTTYLYAAGMIQSIFNALAVWYFASSLTKLLCRRKWFMGVAIFVACIPYALTGIFSVTRIQLAGDILSESFTYPLFLCIFVILLKLLVEKEKTIYKDAHAYVSFLVILLITLIRGQVMALIVVWMLAVLYRVIGECFGASNKQELPQSAPKAGGTVLKCVFGVLIVMATMGIFFVGRTALLKSYGLLIIGRYETHPNLANFALSHVLYVSDRADADKVPDTLIADIVEDDYGNELPELTLRDLFLRMCDKMEEMQWNMAYESGSFFERSTYMDSCNDPLKFKVIENTYVELVKPSVPDYILLDLIENDLSAVIIKALLPSVITPWLTVYARHVFFGSISSIGLTKPLLVPVFLVIYAAALFMMVCAFRSASRKTNHAPAMAMALSLVIIAGFSSSISLMHFCIPRYMFYPFPCFYVSFAALFVSLYMSEKKETTP